MLDSYFFIPGDKSKYLDKITQLKADFIVVDLEDAVAPQNKFKAVENLLRIQSRPNMFVRLPFFTTSFSDAELLTVIKKFNGNIVVPKFKTVQDIGSIISLLQDHPVKMIVLVENPQGFIAIQDVLKLYSEHIQGIGFGSHDFCSIVGMKHTLEYLTYYKQQLILYAKAYRVDFIDGVDLNLTDYSAFKRECLFAFEAGATGKFLIHPNQLLELKRIEFVSEEEYQRMRSIYDKVKDIPTEAIEVYTVNGIVYEKPHIERIKYLINKLQRNMYGAK